MKLATLTDGSRDGLLAVVSRDLTRAHFAVDIASTMQQVLDDWNFRAPQLEDLYAALNGGKLRHAFGFDARHCMAPLPRAYLWAFRGAEDPALRLAASDELSGPCDAVQVSGADDVINVDAGVAAVIGDVPRGCAAEAALESVRLFMLTQHWTLLPSRVSCTTSFSPVAVTPDELGMAWRDGGVLLVLRSGAPGADDNNHDNDDTDDNDDNEDEAPSKLLEPSPAAHFGELVATLARGRRLRAGSIVGCVSPLGVLGSRNGAQRRARVFQAGARVRTEALDEAGHAVFGALDQAVTLLAAAS